MWRKGLRRIGGETPRCAQGRKQSDPPAEDEMSVEAASVHPSVFRIDNPPGVTGCKVDGCLASLFGLGALMGGEEGEGRARCHGVFTARMLLPQVLCDDAV